MWSACCPCVGKKKFVTFGTVGRLQGTRRCKARSRSPTLFRTPFPVCMLGILAALLTAQVEVDASGSTMGSWRRVVQTQFIAALGDASASKGSGAESWGIWTVDPGPRGVRLPDYARLESNGGVAPAGWKFDSNDWWLEEHGLIMEKPDFPLKPGRYMVSGDREVTTPLTISADGSWSLEKGTLYDVTHLPCRAARYAGATPANARPRDFPVTPGAAMPAVDGCSKQDYAVLFVVALPS